MFYKQKSRKDGLQNKCKSCSSKDAREWRQDNKEHVAAFKREYNKVNAVKVAASSKRRRLENKEYRTEYYRVYSKNNKATINAKTANRRARKREATVSWANKELIKDIYQEAQYQGMQVDHIIPLISKTVCGLHWEGNLQLLTAYDNASKSNRYNQDGY